MLDRYDKQSLMKGLKNPSALLNEIKQLSQDPIYLYKNYSFDKNIILR
jgi:hypothetical protein